MRIVGLNTNCYHGYSIEDALKGAANAGFKFIELTATKGWTEHVFPDQSFSRLLSVRELLNDLDLTAFSMSGHTNLMDDERLPDFRMNMQLANFYGCSYIVSSIGEAHLEDRVESANDIIVRNIRSLLPSLEELGLVLVLDDIPEHGLTGAQPPEQAYDRGRESESGERRERETQRYGKDGGHLTLPHLAAASKSLYGILLPLISI